MTFAVLEMSSGTEVEVIGHFKTTGQAIECCESMKEANKDRVFIWIMLPKAK